MPTPDRPEPRAYQYLIGLLVRTVHSLRRAQRARDRRLLRLGAATTFFFRGLRRARAVMQAREVKLRGMWETIGSLTRRVREERVALQASDARYRSLFETVLEGVFQSDAEGRFLLVNPALIEMLGYESATALLGTDVGRHRFVNPADCDAYIARLHEEGAARQVELQLRRQTGEVITVLESTRAIRDADGSLLHYQGAIIDITERKHMEERPACRKRWMPAIRRRHRARFQQPAHRHRRQRVAARSWMRLSRHRGRCRRNQAGGRAGRRAHQPTPGVVPKQIPAPQVLDLNAVCRWRRCSPHRRRGPDAALCMVMADQSQIEQVLMNLAINARMRCRKAGAAIATANSVLTRISRAGIRARGRVPSP